MNYLDRNEFNFEPSEKVIEAIKNFDPRTLCFYTRIYDEGKKSVVSVRLSEIYGVPEEERKQKIAKVTALDYRAIGRRTFDGFKRYIDECNEQAFHDLMKG